MDQGHGSVAGPMRVLFLSWRDRDNPEAGGSEIFVERTAEVLSGLGHEVTIFSASFAGAARHDLHGNVRVLRRGGRFTCYPRGLAHIRAHAHRYDVIVDIQNGVPFWSPLTARVPVVNVVHHVHRDQWRSIFGPLLGRFGWLLESRIAPLVYRRARYVTVSKATRAELVALGVSADRIDIVYSGNDQPANLERYAALPRSPEPTLMVLGRLVPHKHNETAIDILADLREEFPTLTLDVAGSGYWSDHLREHAAARGVSDRVRFHGFVSQEQKDTLLATSWLVLMPSQKEGWGLTIVEAGLHGTPALAFAHAGGVTESIVDGRTGLLARDQAMMTDQVRQLLRDPRRRAELGAAARRHAASFSWDRAGRRLEEILLDVRARAGT